MAAECLAQSGTFTSTPRRLVSIEDVWAERMIEPEDGEERCETQPSGQGSIIELLSSVQIELSTQGQAKEIS